MGLAWKERGPPPPSDPTETWRGQRYREGSGRWANRAGQHAEWFSAYYRAKRSMTPAALQAWVRQNPRPAKQ
jgi:hypothetical protein